MNIMFAINRLPLLILFVSCALLPSQTEAQHCPVDYGFQGTYNFGKDAKSFVRVRSLKEISRPILTRIDEQLTSRVGEIFFRKLHFEYGTVEDWDDAGSLRPDDSKRIDGYDFVFKFSDRSKGLKAFHFKVVADAGGQLIDLPLPDIATDPHKGNLVSCKQAMAIGEKNGFPPARSSIYFVYDWEAMSFVWDISDNWPVEPDEPLLPIGKGTYRKIMIEAYTGRVLKIYKETIAV